MTEAAGIKLITITPDSRQFNELTRAYLFAGVPNLAVPQDNILFASICDFMEKHKIRYFLSGGNFALESILQRGNTYDAYDTVNIKAIHRRYGRGPIDKLLLISNLQRDIDSMIIGIRSPRPLNFIDYNRERAFKELYDFCGVEYYGSKHLENILTRFIQVYWFYHKFKVDKRTSHLSSMIVSDQLTRNDALKLLQEPLYDEDTVQQDIDFITAKLDITRHDFDEIMKKEPVQHDSFRTSNYIRVRKILLKAARRLNSGLSR